MKNETRFKPVNPPLTESHPHLINEWFFEKNVGLLPLDFTSGSHRKVWWKCPKGLDHVWDSQIYNRAHGDGCPICSGRRIVESNSLRKTHPSLASEWIISKNTLSTGQIGAGSHKKAWWKCKNGHEWLAEIKSRVSGNGCPYCAGKQADENSNIDVLFPEIAKQWHPLKNGDLKSKDFVSGSSKNIWWKCKNGHEWKEQVLKRTARKYGCRRCESFAYKYPNLTKDWSSKNLLQPSDFSPKSGTIVWWKCDEGHEYKQEIRGRANGLSCPECKSIFIKNPQLLAEWHSTRNGSINSLTIKAGSDKAVWWKCEKGHEWQDTPGHRMLGRGCTRCNRGWTLEQVRLFVSSIKDYIGSLTAAELYVLFQQNGLLITQGRSESFIKALVTGAFPIEELEKFAKGEDSIVDDFIGNQQQTLEEMLGIGDINVNEIVPVDDVIAEKEMPIIETKDVLSALNNQVMSSADEEAVEFLLTSACSKIWNHAFVNEKAALEQAEEYKGSSYADSVKKRFLEQFNGAKQLSIPAGYNFKIEGKIREPNLMQRLVAYQVQDKKKFGNWSGTGAGKTLSAILASRVIDAKLTIICCPNAVVTGWRSKIMDIYPDSVIHIKTLQPNIDDLESKNHYLILNYEVFQQENSEALVKSLVDQYKVDFVVIDEIHHSKQRVVEDMSKRKRIITGMITSINQNNSNLHVLGMSATPVINNLYEGKALLEMITGVHYDDLKTVSTINNCMSLYQKLATNGLRWMPVYEYKLNEKFPEVDCSEYLDEIRESKLKGGYVALEGVLTKAKLPEIRKHIKEKTIIYTHNLKNIIETLKTGIEKDGWKVAYFTGDDKSGLESFINGDTDVLIASSSIGTGVDGLQYVCNRLIINVLPWTHAEYEQLRGRIYRQGQTQQEVDIIIPRTHAEINGKEWSWCESKWNRIQFKKSIADAAVDGKVPEGHQRSPAQTYEDAMSWLKRLEEGKMHQIERRPIYIPLSDTVIQTRVRKFGDFSEMNRRINTSNSETTNKRFQKNPDEWELYHALYREARKEWTIIPYEEIIKWCKKRPELVIGDFGCGEAKLAAALENTVHSFDHVAIHDKVIACDMSKVPLESECLDVAVYSLSLMGTNITDYLKEAHRCLKLDGTLYIAESTSHFTDIDNFIKGLEKLGFDVLKPEVKYKFTFIRAIKSERKPLDIVVKF